MATSLSSSSAGDLDDAEEHGGSSVEDGEVPEPSAKRAHLEDTPALDDDDGSDAGSASPEESLAEEAPADCYSGPMEGDDSSTVFVRGLAESVTEDIVWELFGHAGPVVRVSLRRSGDPARPGVAFIEFFNRDAADAAVWMFGGLQLGGFQLEIRLATTERVHESDEWTLHARGIHPFVDGACLFDLFLPAAVPTACRTIGGPRAAHAAFVVFSCWQDACRALLCVDSTVLFGRRLSFSLSRRTLAGAMAKAGFPSQGAATGALWQLDAAEHEKYPKWKQQGLELASQHRARLGIEEPTAHAAAEPSLAAPAAVQAPPTLPGVAAGAGAGSAGSLQPRSAPAASASASMGAKSILGEAPPGAARAPAPFAAASAAPAWRRQDGASTRAAPGTPHGPAPGPPFAPAASAAYPSPQQPAYQHPPPAHSPPQQPAYWPPQPAYSHPPQAFSPPQQAQPPPQQAYSPPQHPVYSQPQQAYWPPHQAYSAPHQAYSAPPPPHGYAGHGSPPPQPVYAHGGYGAGGQPQRGHGQAQAYQASASAAMTAHAGPAPPRHSAPPYHNPHPYAGHALPSPPHVERAEMPPASAPAPSQRSSWDARTGVRPPEFQS